jgi:tetratricopeptide (TPR) repeat protein
VAKLVIFRGDAVEKEIRLAGDTVRIGRHTRNDIVLDDSLNGVSRFHAEIRNEAGTYFIVDLNSRNGVWIKGRRIKEKAALAFGVPVTVGAFELALEDDVSTGEFDVPLVDQRTVVSAGSADRRDGPSHSASRSMRSPVTGIAGTKRSALLWSGAAAVLLLIFAIPFAVVRYMGQAPTTVATVEPQPGLPPEPAVPTTPPPGDSNKALIEQNLADARSQISAGDYAGALREHLQPVLELEPENREALELKRRADEAITAAAQALKAKPVVKPEQPTEVETPGIPRRSNEVWADYTARARRIQVALAEGKTSLDKQEFAAALNHFRAVERDQSNYQGVDLLIADALGKQQKAFEEAMNGGQLNEQAGKLHEARLWYQRALEVDPSSIPAREKNQLLLGRMTAEANKLFDRATFALKSQDTAGAIRQFQQILDLMLPGDEIREKAAKQLEVLKR